MVDFPVVTIPLKTLFLLILLFLQTLTGVESIQESQKGINLIIKL